MEDQLFSYTTEQAARTLDVRPDAMRTQYRRTGAYRGVKPVAVARRRLLWPRAAILALAGRCAAGPRATIDLRATNPWIESRGLLPNDPMAEAIAIALCDPRDDLMRTAQCNLDDVHALRHWNEAQQRRLTAARRRLSPEQWTNAQRYLALAVASIVADLPEETLRQAVSDLLGGAV